MKEEIFETDVLCIGGGIAGLMAAIRATELGAKVIIAEKANTLRSGAAATGNDHFKCYIPEVHGSDIEPIVEQIMHSPMSGAMSKKSIQTWMEKSFDIVKLWDKWGIPMTYQGQWEFAGHGIPGHTLIDLKYAGLEQKPILTKEALKRGAEIVNRVMVSDLLVDDNGDIVGAVGTDTREEKIIIFRAKSIILGTGRCVRLYPSPTQGWMFNRSHNPGTTGDGRAMAYRAGVDLFDVELPRRWAGLKYFFRCGKASWIGVIRDPQDKPVGPFVNKPDRKLGDAISDVYTSLFEDFTKSGKGPVYMDCRGMSDEDNEYMLHWLIQEGNSALIDNLKEEGIDLRKNPIEFMTYELNSGGGIVFNESAETSMKGLYAAGDEYFGGISFAATFGWVGGENAAAYIKQKPSPKIDKARAEIEKRKDLLNAMRNRAVGATWREVNIALEQIMQDYAGAVRSESLLTAGLGHLRRLREKTYNTITAKNQHELMRCLEVINLLDIGELVFLASIERRETRGSFRRHDYPFTNPVMNNKQIICKKISGRPVVEWRETKR